MNVEPSIIDLANDKMIHLCFEIVDEGKYDYRAHDEYIEYLKSSKLSHLAHFDRMKTLFRLNCNFIRQEKNWIQSLSPDIFSFSPVLELYPLSAPKSPKGTRDRWISMGGKIKGGKMVALITDDVWASFSKFSMPWPPFDYDNTMFVRDISYPEIESFGLSSKGIDPSKYVGKYDLRLISVDDPGLTAYLTESSKNEEN
jgi:hypothetical protein